MGNMGLFDMFDQHVLETYNITLDQLNAFEKAARSSELKFVIFAAMENRKIDRAKEVLNRYI